MKTIQFKIQDQIIPKEAVKAMIRKVKINGTNKITFSEFALMLTPANPIHKFETAPKFVEYSPRRETLAESSSPKFNRSLNKTKGNW